MFIFVLAAELNIIVIRYFHAQNHDTAIVCCMFLVGQVLPRSAGHEAVVSRRRFTIRLLSLFLGIY